MKPVSSMWLLYQILVFCVIQSATFAQVQSDPSATINLVNTEPAFSTNSAKSAAKQDALTGSKLIKNNLNSAYGATPRHYSLTLVPHVTKWNYSASATINAEVSSETKILRLDCVDLKIKAVSVQYAGRSLQPTRLSGCTKEYKKLKIELPEGLAVGSIVINIKFDGKLRSTHRGIFRANHRDPFFASDFALGSASLVFPCWDSPQYLSEYQMTIVLPKTMTAVASATSIADISPSDDGKLIHKFRRTTFISTVNFGFVFGTLKKLPPPKFIPVPNTKAILNLYVPFNQDDQNSQTVYDAFYYTFEEVQKLMDCSLQFQEINLIVGFESTNDVTNPIGLIFLPSRALSDSKEASDVSLLHSLLFPQLIQQWIGGMVRVSTWDDLWIQYAIPQFVLHSLTSNTITNEKWETNTFHKFGELVGGDTLKDWSVSEVLYSNGAPSDRLKFKKMAMKYVKDIARQLGSYRALLVALRKLLSKGIPEFDTSMFIKELSTDETGKEITDAPIISFKDPEVVRYVIHDLNYEKKAPNRLTKVMLTKINHESPYNASVCGKEIIFTGASIEIEIPEIFKHVCLVQFKPSTNVVVIQSPRAFAYMSFPRNFDFYHVIYAVKNTKYRLVNYFIELHRAAVLFPRINKEEVLRMFIKRLTSYIWQAPNSPSKQEGLEEVWLMMQRFYSHFLPYISDKDTEPTAIKAAYAIENGASFLQREHTSYTYRQFCMTDFSRIQNGVALLRKAVALAGVAAYPYKLAPCHVHGIPISEMTSNSLGSSTKFLESRNAAAAAAVAASPSGSQENSSLFDPALPAEASYPIFLHPENAKASALVTKKMLNSHESCRMAVELLRLFEQFHTLPSKISPKVEAFLTGNDEKAKDLFLRAIAQTRCKKAVSIVFALLENSPSISADERSLFIKSLFNNRFLRMTTWRMITGSQIITRKNDYNQTTSKLQNNEILKKEMSLEIMAANSELKSLRAGNSGSLDVSIEAYFEKYAKSGDSETLKRMKNKFEKVKSVRAIVNSQYDEFVIHVRKMIGH